MADAEGSLSGVPCQEGSCVNRNGLTSCWLRGIPCQRGASVKCNELASFWLRGVPCQGGASVKRIVLFSLEGVPAKRIGPATSRLSGVTFQEGASEKCIEL